MKGRVCVLLVFVALVAAKHHRHTHRELETLDGEPNSDMLEERNCYHVYAGFGQTTSWTSRLASAKPVNHISVFLEPVRDGSCNKGYMVDRRAFTHLPEYGRISRLDDLTETELTERNQKIRALMLEKAIAIPDCTNVVMYHWSGYNIREDMSELQSLARPHKLCTNYLTVKDLTHEARIGRLQPIYLSMPEDMAKTHDQYPLNLDGFVRLGVSPPISEYEIERWIFDTTLSHLNDFGVHESLKNLGYMDFKPPKGPKASWTTELVAKFKKWGTFFKKIDAELQRVLFRTADPGNGHLRRGPQFDGFYNNCAHFARRLVMFLAGSSTSSLGLQARALLPNFYSDTPSARGEPEALTTYLGEGWTDKWPPILVNAQFTATAFEALGRPIPRGKLTRMDSSHNVLADARKEGQRGLPSPEEDEGLLEGAHPLRREALEIVGFSLKLPVLGSQDILKFCDGQYPPYPKLLATGQYLPPGETGFVPYKHPRFNYHMLKKTMIENPVTI